MRASAYHISTLKEAPNDAEIASHQLMMRSGMIRKLAGGIYNYMPLGLRVIRKVENIIRQEMDAAGALELLMPVVQPAELWMESGRWEQYGPELLRMKDRHGRDFILQPTSEEVITDIARNEIQSWRHLPVNFYHIQTKFRDERRPRFGVMRGREFTMKDAYSFDRDVAGAQKSYQVMFDAYMRIFSRLGLTFRAVAADTGSIGGSQSHEFQVIADIGEDLIVYDPNSNYAANIELAPAPSLIAKRAAAGSALTSVATPGATKCELVADFLNIPLSQTVKSIVLATEPKDQPVQIWLLLLRGDHELNEIKVGKITGLDKGFRFASEAEIVEHFGCKPGYLGPIGTKLPVKVIADLTVANMHDFVCGANQEDAHLTGVNWGRDLPEPMLVSDLRNVVEGDLAPDGLGKLAIQRGIEVGHVFYLGTKYSEALKATFLDENGKPALMEMGCYGIGVTRIVGAAIEQNHDAKGIVWPRAIAPFEVAICAVGWGKSEAVRQTSEALYAELKARGVDVILDDRDQRPGIMFAEWELIGPPVRITVGERGLNDGIVELLGRKQNEAAKVVIADCVTQTLALLELA
ncbi:proline--tRNA ligase [Zwartia sp.]|uniref:proline--tRNA ligase n=1 Tax=Zwartia sp. TaxID=2978004 RepID=UPI0027169B34|nr:proline--tRNA ligase [Zwartia sp.]MDO9024702.1 proline--tRNA ligase [Zwartia sp.]